MKTKLTTISNKEMVVLSSREDEENLHVVIRVLVGYTTPSYHVTPNRKLFSSYEVRYCRMMQMNNTSVLKIVEVDKLQ